MEAWRIDALRNHLEFLRSQQRQLRQALQQQDTGMSAHRRHVLRELQQLSSTIERLEKSLKTP